jgi:hypothetical protein
MPWSQHSDPGPEQHADGQTLQAFAAHERTPDDATLRHIARCPQCMANLATLRSQVPEPSASASHAHCPPVETIQAYALGQLARAQKRSVQVHIKECLRCAAEVAASREFLLASEPAIERAGVAAAAADALRRVIAVLLAPQGVPVFVLKDGGETHIQVFRADGVDVALDHEPAEHGRFLLHGSLTMRDETQAQGAPPPLSSASSLSSSSLAPLVARLLRVTESDPDAAPVPVAEAPIEANGFEFDDVPAGSYQIEILFPDRLIVVASVAL